MLLAIVLIGVVVVSQQQQQQQAIGSLSEYNSLHFETMLRPEDFVQRVSSVQQLWRCFGGTGSAAFRDESVVLTRSWVTERDAQLVIARDYDAPPTSSYDALAIRFEQPLKSAVFQEPQTQPLEDGAGVLVVTLYNVTQQTQKPIFSNDTVGRYVELIKVLSDVDDSFTLSARRTNLPDDYRITNPGSHSFTAYYTNIPLLLNEIGVGDVFLRAIDQYEYRGVFDGALSNAIVGAVETRIEIQLRYETQRHAITGSS